MALNSRMTDDEYRAVVDRLKVFQALCGEKTKVSVYKRIHHRCVVYVTYLSVGLFITPI